jgi:hypothetical protein
VKKILPPLKQIKSGISIKSIQCRKYNSLVLIQKIDGLPTYVKPETIPKLIERGGHHTTKNKTDHKKQYL